MDANQRRVGRSTTHDFRGATAPAGLRAAVYTGAPGAIEGGFQVIDDDIYYRISAATDITITWRRYGWVPPSELPEYQAKWAKAQEPTKLRDMR